DRARRFRARAREPRRAPLPGGRLAASRRERVRRLAAGPWPRRRRPFCDGAARQRRLCARVHRARGVDRARGSVAAGSGRARRPRGRPPSSGFLDSSPAAGSASGLAAAPYNESTEGGPRVTGNGRRAKARWAVLVAAAALGFADAGTAATPIADAAMRGDAAEVSRLLDQREDPNAQQADGATALHWAV